MVYYNFQFAYFCESEPIVFDFKVVHLDSRYEPGELIAA